MFFSVLMSLYIKEKPSFLHQCFESIWQNQTTKPNEIVLVLDGAITEELEELVSLWQNKIGSILRVVRLPENLGLGKALNEGLKYCTHEWVFRMDTDDICKSDRFEKQIAFIQKNPEVSVVGGQILEFDKEPNDLNVIKSVPLQHSEIKEFSNSRCPFNHMTVAYKKSVIQKVGGYQHHLFMEDYNLWLRVIGNGYQVANIPDVVLYARVGNGMHARRKGIEYIKSEKKLLDLKKQLKLQSPVHANILFLIRSAFRLLPSGILGKVYNNFLRKKNF